MEATKNRPVVAAIMLGMLVVVALIAGVMARSGALQADRAIDPVGTSNVVAESETSTVEQPQVVVAPEIQLVGVAGTTAKKTAAFAGCIFGVGVPIGAAWGIATNPAAWAWVLGKGPFPASVGGGLYKYMETVKRMCAYAIR